jgi:hypothetical protein
MISNPDVPRPPHRLGGVAKGRSLLVATSPSNRLSSPNKNKGEEGDVSNHKKHNDQNNGERDNASEDLMRRRIGNPTNNEQIDPNRRSTDGDLHGDHEYDRKVNFIDA